MTQHVVPVRIYGLVFAALLALLALTVAVAYMPLGRWGLLVALSIAVAKAALIMLYFMHLRYEDALLRVLAASGIVWLLLLFTFLLSDYLTRDVVRGM